MVNEIALSSLSLEQKPTEIRSDAEDISDRVDSLAQNSFRCFCCDKDARYILALTAVGFLVTGAVYMGLGAIEHSNYRYLLIGLAFGVSSIPFIVYVVRNRKNDKTMNESTSLV